MKQFGGILSYFTRHRTAANLLMVLVIALGLAAAPRMRAQYFPDVVIDSVSVSVTWNGAGAEDVDAGIVQVLQPALLAVEGVQSSSARSSEGRASLSLEFEPGWDMARAADDVQAAVDAVSTLPDGAEEPQVRRGAWRDRVTDVVITGPVAPELLGRYADELVIRLFDAGVTRTTVQGVAAPETIVQVPTLNLIRYDISMAEIAEHIAAEVTSNPAGDIDSANARIRTGTTSRQAEDIRDIRLRSDDDGSFLTIGDVARVVDQGVDREAAYFVGSNPAISVRVDRSEEGDAIEIQQLVQDAADELQLTLPEGVAVDLIRTRAESITGRLNILLDNGLLGLGLVVTLLFLFLNARTAFWVAAGIPVAMAATLTLMYVFGITINMISLFALIITLGIVVDDAIVVGEHADFRARRLGEDAPTAAENAARRMAAPVFSATVTTVIAFFGLAVVGGRFGDLIADIPFTVSVVLLASLMECFLILPHHMHHALTHVGKRHWYDWPNRIVNKGFGWFRDKPFKWLMRLVITMRYPVVAAAVLVLSLQIAMFIRGDVQWRFFNAPERSSVTGNFAMLSGATREDALEMMAEMQRATEELAAEYEAEHGTNPLSYVVAQIGSNAGFGLSGTENKTPDQLGGISIELIDADLRPYSAFAFVADLQDRVRPHPLAETVSFRGWRSGPGGDSLSVDFYGADVATLKAAAEALKTAVSRFPEVSALQDSLGYDKEELILELTPQGQALGFDIEGLGRVLRNRLGGIEAATYPVGMRTASIRVELPEGEIKADFLDSMQLRAPTGEYLPLADIVTVTRQTGFSTIQRENGIALVSVTGDISEDDPARAAEISERLQDEILPRIASLYGVEWQLSGLAEQEREFLSDAFLGFVLCIIGIYLTLTWVFASWTRPLIVLAIVPFGLVGAIWGHDAWSVPFSMFSVVGLIGMTGIIINDSIVLVTTVDDYAQSRGLVPAIVEATADRLRPVLLTTLTTVLGLTPLLFEGSVQAEFLKPTVITLVYGLAFGMVLVLLVVPSLLAIQQDVTQQFRALRRILRVGRRAPVVQVVVVLVSAALVALCSATLGSWIWAGKLPGFVPLAAQSTAGVFALFVGASAGLLVLVSMFGGVVQFTRRWRKS